MPMCIWGGVQGPTPTHATGMVWGVIRLPVSLIQMRVLARSTCTRIGCMADYYFDYYPASLAVWAS